MKYQNVADAFDIVITELEAALKEARGAAAAATEQGKYDEAQTLLNKARRIEKFLGEIRAKQREWTTIDGASRRKRPVKGDRLERGQRTPEGAYRLPILRALASMGGEGNMREVLDRVFEEMKSRLKPVDLKPLPSDARTPRWRNAAQWERQAMVNEGLLRSDSPRGIWAITDKGRKYLADHSA